LSFEMEMVIWSSVPFLFSAAVMFAGSFSETLFWSGSHSILQPWGSMGLIWWVECLWSRRASHVKWWRECGPVLCTIFVCFAAVHTSFSEATCWLQVKVLSCLLVELQVVFPKLVGSVLGIFLSMLVGWCRFAQISIISVHSHKLGLLSGLPTCISSSSQEMTTWMCTSCWSSLWNSEFCFVMAWNVPVVFGPRT
jgi:hypothetical protein